MLNATTDAGHAKCQLHAAAVTMSPRAGVAAGQLRGALQVAAAVGRKGVERRSAAHGTAVVWVVGTHRLYRLANAVVGLQLLDDLRSIGFRGVSLLVSDDRHRLMALLHP